MNGKMNAIKVDLKKSEINYVSTDIPRVIDSTDVIVRIAYAGVCGTDLHIIQGKFPAKDNVTLGHEMCGVVHEVHKENTTLRVGDRVTINPNRCCGLCLHCRRGKVNGCITGGLKSTLGIVHDGGWALYCRIPVLLISKISDSVPLQLAVLTEPLSCIVRGLEKISPIEVGETIVILGAGIVGVLWCCILHLLGHRNVTVSEPNANRRKYIQNMNLGYKSVSWAEVEEHQKMNPGWEIDLCIDCSGSAKAMEDAIPLLRFGGTICIFGVANPEAVVRMKPYEIFWKELSVIGSNINTPTSFSKAVNLLESLIDSKYLSYEKLGIKAYPLKNYKEALEDLKTGNYTKVAFKLE